MFGRYARRVLGYIELIDDHTALCGKTGQYRRRVSILPDMRTRTATRLKRFRFYRQALVLVNCPPASVTAVLTMFCKSAEAKDSVSRLLK